MVAVSIWWWRLRLIGWNNSAWLTNNNNSRSSGRSRSSRRSRPRRSTFQLLREFVLQIQSWSLQQRRWIVIFRCSILPAWLPHRTMLCFPGRFGSGSPAFSVFQLSGKPVHEYYSYPLNECDSNPYSTNMFEVTFYIIVGWLQTSAFEYEFFRNQ